MSHDEAIEKSREYTFLVDRAFLNANNEKETIKAVVAWEEGENNWQPHVCFYNWAVTSQGRMSHMPVLDFLRRYPLLEENKNGAPVIKEAAGRAGNASTED